MLGEEGILPSVSHIVEWQNIYDEALARADHELRWSGGRVMSLSRRALVCGLSVLGCGAASGIVPRPFVDDQLASDVGTLLLFGFVGTKADAPAAQRLAEHIGTGRAAGALFVKDNVGSRSDATGLVELFRGSSLTLPPTIAIDHEGGAVQRFVERHGFTRLPSALAVASSLPPSEAEAIFLTAAKELAEVGFTLNLAPVLDLHYPANPAVGHYGRAFASDPAIVASYARVFVSSFARANIACAAKHFPGAGFARMDSHLRTVPDVSGQWSEKELDPYIKLIADGRLACVMTGHLRLRQVGAEQQPATLSPQVVTDLLRNRLGFSGVTISDDIDMLPMDRESALVGALAAGNDLVIINNKSLADQDLPLRALDWVRSAVASGKLSASQLAVSAARVRRLRLGPTDLSVGDL